MVRCLPGDDIVANTGDTCNFTCNTKLTGSATKTRQSDGSWNRSDALCESEYLLRYYSI